MPMTMEEILRETQSWPTEKVDELVDQLYLRFQSTSKHDETWKREIRRRVAEIENVSVPTVDGK